MPPPIMLNDSSPVQASAPARIRRRNRQISSCLECRRRKLKCDKQAPCCGHCARFRRDCLYLAPAMDPPSRQKLAEIKEKMGMLEKSLESEVAAAHTPPAHSSGGNATQFPAGDHKARGQETAPEEGDKDELNEDDDNLEPNPLATQDNVYDDNSDDELMDLGVQMGKMRISERIGGWLRPKLADEITDTLEDVKAAKTRLSESSAHVDDREVRPDVHVGPKVQPTPKSFIGPGPDYIAPASSFFFPATNMSTTLIEYLPNKMAADELIAQYWHAVHYMCKTVHRPTFEQQYSQFWTHIAIESAPVPSSQALVFAAMFSAAVSMTHEQVMQRFGASKEALVDSLRSGTEFALAKSNFLRTTKVDTMQAFVMYLIPLVRAEVSRAHSALVGCAIRLAECMGLHRDGTYYSMTPVEVQVRRMIWHQLCFLDMRTCEATGPRPQIRAEDYDTRMPWNVDDADLMSDQHPVEDGDYWTDTTFERIRAECQEMRRKVWYDILEMDKKKKSLTSVLVKIQKFTTATKERYLPMLDTSIPFQRLAGLMLEYMTKGLHLQVLHRYVISTTQRMPDRLRQVLIEAGLTQMESSVAWECSSDMAPWLWYRGAFNQYHAALLLLIEVYAYPMRKEAARIWKCLDYVFETPSHLAPKQKAELVLTDLRDRMETFHQMRKMKISDQMQQRVGGGSTSQLRTFSAISSDTVGHVRQPNDAATGITPTPLPPPQPNWHSGSGGNMPEPSTTPQHAQQGGPGYAEMPIQEIDWAEWEKVFHPDIYTGDLNIPDFDMSDFTGIGNKNDSNNNYNNNNNYYNYYNYNYSHLAGSTLDPYTSSAPTASNLNSTRNPTFAAPRLNGAVAASLDHPSSDDAFQGDNLAGLNFDAGPSSFPSAG